jgi:hypothetical protein
MRVPPQVYSIGRLREADWVIQRVDAFGMSCADFVPPSLFYALF